MKELYEDVLLNVYEYLSPSDLRALCGVNKRFLLGNAPAMHWVWVGHLARKWNIGEDIVRNFVAMNCSEIRSIYPMSHGVIGRITSDDVDHELRMDAEALLFEFVGRVGESNRSIQGDVCFPAIVTQPKSFMDSVLQFVSNFAESARDSMDKDVLCIHNPTAINESSCHVCPFAYESLSGSISYYTKPRHISYFEVHIKPPSSPPALLPELGVGIQIPAEEEEELGGGGITRTPQTCVAVGLSTKQFRRDKRLPGWDAESFGYHGDDGAIFHKYGRPVSTFGPQFGCNDVVGCGVNHNDNTIFYTLNGAFLGVAFTDAPCNKELYPTVGIDANVSVQLNFGLKPFQFNLVQHLHQQENQ